MADHDEGQAAFAAQVFEQVEHLGLYRRVERGRGFVEQHDLRLQDQCARDRDALALAARQLVRVTEAKSGAQPDFVQRAFDPGLGVADVVDGQWFGQDPVHGLARVQ